MSISIRQTSRKKQEKVVKVKSSKSVKPIMISYARQEAAQHALDLKRQLVSLGFSVYLVKHQLNFQHKSHKKFFHLGY